MNVHDWRAERPDLAAYRVARREPVPDGFSAGRQVVDCNYPLLDSPPGTWG